MWALVTLMQQSNSNLAQNLKSEDIPPSRCLLMVLELIMKVEDKVKI